MVLEGQVLHCLQSVQGKPGLRPHQLELLALALHPGRTGLGAHANPVNARRRRQAAIGFHGNLETLRVQRVNQVGVHLQQGLAAGQHHKAVGAVTRGPQGGNLRSQGLGAVKAAAQRAVSANKVGIAKLADGSAAVLFAARPQVAAGKAAKHGGLAGVGAFALQGVENFLDLVAHGATARGGRAQARQGVSRTVELMATTIAARFLYMVVLYMARKNKAPAAPDTLLQEGASLQARRTKGTVDAPGWRAPGAFRRTIGRPLAPDGRACSPRQSRRALGHPSTLLALAQKGRSAASATIRAAIGQRAAPPHPLF